MRSRDLSGTRVGRLTALRLTGFTEQRRAIWLCRCDCGNELSVTADRIGGTASSKQKTSCGCDSFAKRSVAKRTHGAFGSLTYGSWTAMIQRCENERHVAFPRYGGAGIRICERWRSSFELFLADMGERPSRDHSIDRTNGSLGYEPGNCRWATRQQQQSNQKTARKIEINGVVDSVNGWSRKTGVNATTIIHRLNKGIPAVEAVKAVLQCA